MSAAAADTARIGHYRLGKTLGVGSFGKVKLAEHELTGHKVAIKIINRGKMRKPEEQRKVRLEISLLQRMRHQHIIQLFQVIDTPTDIFMVLEYVSDGELFDYIVSKGRLPPQEARRLFQQIVCGLEYCHAHGIVHRDLKPENLLLDAKNNIKIADFGLANVMRDGDFLKTPCGSPHYAAPEVIYSQAYAGPEVDVWSCGVILYALLCGSLPFEAEHLPTLFKKIRSGMYMLPSSLPDEARDLIPRMLVVDPLRRITIAEIRQHPWFRESLPVPLHSPPDILRPQRDRVIDEELLAKCLLLNVRHCLTREALIEAVHEKSDHALRVAYDLMLQHKQSTLQNLDPVVPSPEQAVAFSSTTLLLPGRAPLPMAASPIVKHARSDPRISFGNGGADEEYASIANAKRRRWYLGIQSKKDPAHVMTEVYRALLTLGFDWKAESVYRIRCRWQPPASLPASSPVEEPSDLQPSHLSVKIRLQLYKVQQGIFLLDFQRLDGNAFTFMNLCSCIVIELKSLSGVRQDRTV